MTFLKPGIFTSVQDTGRFGYRQHGVPVSGAMDLQHAQLANLLVNNASDTPLLEITLSGPEIHFSEGALISLTGADLSPRLNDASVVMNTALAIKPGQVLSFGKSKYGVRTYLAVRGGFACEKILNSHAQYYPVTASSRIEKGYELAYKPSLDPIPNAVVKMDMDHFQHDQLEIFQGPEYDMLDNSMKKMLVTEPFKIGENNRMGYQLINEKVPENSLSIITAPVIPGTVQLTPSGKLIVLMRDGQVTGGYPRILQLTDQSINRLAQKGTGQVVMFDIR